MRKKGCRSATTGSAFPRIHPRQLCLASLATTAPGVAARYTRQSRRAGGTADAKALVNGVAAPSDSSTQVLSGRFVEHAFRAQRENLP